MPGTVQDCTFDMPKRAVTHAPSSARISLDAAGIGRTPRDAAGRSLWDDREARRTAMRIRDLWRFGSSTTPTGIHELPANGVVHLPRGDGLRLRVARGQIWVTRAGDREDHVLGEGAVLELERHGRALAWALQPSRIEVSREAEPAALPAHPALAR